MFEEQRLCGHGAYTTWVEEFREGDKQVNGEDEEFAHGANATTPAILRNIARHGLIRSYCEFATNS